MVIKKFLDIWGKKTWLNFIYPQLKAIMGLLKIDVWGNDGKKRDLNLNFYD